MNEVIKGLSEYNFIDVFNILFFSVTAIVLIVRVIEKIGKKLYSYFLHLYNKKRGKEIKNATIENSIVKIKVLSDKIEQIEKQQKNNVKMFTEHEVGVLDKLDVLTENVGDLTALVRELNLQNEALREKVDLNNEANKTVDLALLRDRILGGMRFFGQNKDENDNVHISASDFENMSHLYEEYFKRNGNGRVKKKYEDEFIHFIIDD